MPLSSDITFHFLLDPVPLFPLPCLFRWQPLIPIPGSATVFYVAWVSTLVWNGCAYGACFMYRHQAVVPPGFPGKFSYRTRLIVIGATVVFTSLCGLILFVARMREEETIPLWSQTSGFSDDELRRVDCYETGTLYVYIGYCFVCFGAATVFLGFLTTHILVMLRDVARISMSEKTREFHKKMTKALATQASVAFFFLIAPLVSCLIIFLARIEISILYPLTFLSVHSFTHSSVVLGTTPLYRKSFKELLLCRIIKTIRIIPHEQTETSLHRKPANTNS